MKRPWVAIQRNPRSGSGPRAKILLDLIAGLKRHGLRPHVFSQRERCDLRLNELAPEDQPRCLVAAGGDGTVGDLVNRFPKHPIAVLPLGTENLLARYLGIPRSGQFVADMIEAGQMRSFDLCTVGNRRFTLMAGFGFDADVVRRVDESRQGYIRHWSYARPVWQAFRKYDFPEMRFYVDDDPEPRLASLGFVVNMPVYGFRLPIANTADPGDGLLDLRLFPPKSMFQFLRHFAGVVFNRHEKHPLVQCLQAKKVRVECDREVPVQVDGDPAGFTPATIQVQPASFQVLVPPVAC
jgi:diacylglycerol kinase family enzyme